MADHSNHVLGDMDAVSRSKTIASLSTNVPKPPTAQIIFEDFARGNGGSMTMHRAMTSGGCAAVGALPTVKINDLMEYWEMLLQHVDYGSNRHQSYQEEEADDLVALGGERQLHPLSF